MNLSRRRFLFCAPAVILTPGLLMSVKSLKPAAYIPRAWHIDGFGELLSVPDGGTDATPFTTDNMIVRATVRWVPAPLAKSAFHILNGDGVALRSMEHPLNV